jgi:hypothetical protein
MERASGSGAQLAAVPFGVISLHRRSAVRPFGLVFGSGFCRRLPLHVGRSILTAARKRDDVIDNVPRTGTLDVAVRRTRMLSHERSPTAERLPALWAESGEEVDS